MTPAYFVPTRFVWRFGGRQVHLCGSFTRWVETVPMAPVESNPGVFAVVVHLPPGYHQYKFIVDGKWRHDETAPFMPDPLGNVNNWLFVRRIDPGLSTHPSLEQQQQQQQAAAVAVQQQQQLLTQAHLEAAAATAAAAGGPAVSSAMQAALDMTSAPADVDMASAEAAVVPPIVIHNPKEPEYTRKKISDFLHSHTAYELIPESGKIVVLDADLPVRQAFHALHEQGIASAPVWDSCVASITGVISASDFINILTRLRHSVSAGASPMSDAQMDAHTIRGMWEEVSSSGRDQKPLVYVKPNYDMAKVVQTLSQHKCSMAPILSADPGGDEIPMALHLATLSAVLACLMRHFRASLASLPLLAQPLGSLPIGTWSPDAGVAHADTLPDSKDRRQWRRLQPLHTVTPATPLLQAFGLLLEAGVSALPVVDEKRCLLDVYARSDITSLAKANAYSQLQWEDVTVGQALALAAPGAVVPPIQPPSPASPSSHPVMGGLSAELQAQQQHAVMLQQHIAAGGSDITHPNATSKANRLCVCSKDDQLRTIVERLSVPGIRRVVVIQPETRRVEGVISLSDVASYLFL